MPVGILGTNLDYTSKQLDGHLSAIAHSLTSAGFQNFRVVTAADNAAVHRKTLLLMGNADAHSEQRTEGGLGVELATGEDAILTHAAYRYVGESCETVPLTDPAHGLKNATLQPLSMARVLTLGQFAVLSMHLVAVQAKFPEAGLCAAHVNGSDRMDLIAAQKRANVAVREALAQLPGTLATLALMWASACTAQAYFDRSDTTTTRMRGRWVCRNLVFLRWWKGWLSAVELQANVHFISMETFAAHVIEDHAMLLLILMYAQRFPDKPFAPWLFGSDQNEHFFSELRSFRINQPNWTVADLLPLVQRFIHEHEMLSQPDVHLPCVRSAKGYARSNYVPSTTPSKHIPAEQLTCADLRAEYAAAVEEVRPLFVLLAWVCRRLA